GDQFRRLARSAITDLFDQRRPFGRLALTHVLMTAGDTMFAVSLAGSLFFSISPTAAKDKVLLYLLLTMGPSPWSPRHWARSSTGAAEPVGPWWSPRPWAGPSSARSSPGTSTRCSCSPRLSSCWCCPRCTWSPRGHWSPRWPPSACSTTHSATDEGSRRATPLQPRTPILSLRAPAARDPTLPTAPR